MVGKRRWCALIVAVVLVLSAGLAWRAGMAQAPGVEPLPQLDTASSRAGYVPPPFVQIWPTSGPPGTTVALLGEGFAPNITVNISVVRETTDLYTSHLTTVPLTMPPFATARTSDRGTLLLYVPLPAESTLGTQWSVAVSIRGRAFTAASNVFTVVAPESLVVAQSVPLTVSVPLIVATPLPVVPTPVAETPLVVSTPTPLPPAPISPLPAPTLPPTAVPPTLVPPTPIPPTPIPPTPTVSSQVAGVWQASYFANQTLSGAPVATTQVTAIDFNWGEGVPMPGLAADDFSARFEQTIDLPEGFYTMTAQADDGVRVFVNDAVVIDEWHLGQPEEYRIGLQLAGPTRIRVEYYEGGGQAGVRFALQPVNSFPQWQVSFFDNIELAGQPVWIQPEEQGVDAAISRQWSLESPVPGVVAVDNWSARWVGTFPFNAGNYVMRAEANDGVRVWIDDILVIDRWQDETNQAEQVFQNLSTGNHTVRVEYYERGGIANLKVWWTPQ